MVGARFIRGQCTAFENDGVSEIHPGIFRIKLPLPGKKPDHVNTYLFMGSKPLLFDTGMNLTVGRLESAFNRLGMKFSNLDRIVLSHGHFDHYGAAAAVVKRSDKPISVMAHFREAGRMARGNGLGLTMGDLLLFLRRSGLPLRFMMSVLQVAFLFDRFAGRITADTLSRQGDVIMAGDYPARVVEVSGHSQGGLCLYLTGENMMFASDHILSYLPHSDPYLFHLNGHEERFNQIDYFNSLETLRALKPRTIFPGHGDEIRGLDSIIRAYTMEYEKKDAKIIRALNRGAVTVYGIIRQVFPGVLKPSMGFSIYIALSEVYTHLQILVRDGRVRSEHSHGVTHYAVSQDTLHGS